MDRGPVGYFLRGDVLPGSQCEVGALVLAALQESAGGVDKQAGLALGDLDVIEVDATGGVDGGSGVSQGEGDVDLVLLDVGRPERGPRRLASLPRRRRPAS